MDEPQFVAALRDPDAYPHPCGEIRMLETHISWVFLTGTFAYKLKKPVDFGFLDFSTLAKRHFYCNEEYRFNSRFAPELYCGVVAITREAGGRIQVDGDGEIVEYAVKMHEFDERRRLDAMLENGELDEETLRRFAADLARIYDTLPPIAHDTGAGDPARILVTVRDNFRDLGKLRTIPGLARPLARLRTWSLATHERLREVFDARIRGGSIKERHGDLHLSNLVATDRGVRAFDCIEFSDELRRIDAINDIAFLFMDCAVRGRDDLAYAFIDAYLDATGDYAGMRMLKFYAVYRSLVRAKVAALQFMATADDGAAARVRRHIAWADAAIAPRPRRIVLMCGPSGSGKSWLAERLAPKLPALRIRSDIVRHRLAGLGPRESSNSTLAGGIYTRSHSTAVYRYLLELTGALLASGENVIVDATFTSAENRAMFETLGLQQRCACVVVCCEAQPEVLLERIARRRDKGSDPSEATAEVLERQLAEFDPPASSERVVRVATDGAVDIATIVRQIETA